MAIYLGCFFHMVVLFQWDTVHFCPSGPSHPPWEVKFASEAAMAAQVEGAEHLPDTQHVAQCDLPEGPGILVVLLHLNMLLL